MAEMNVPGIGTVDQKYVYAGGALVAGIAGYAWWKAKSNAAPAVVPGVDTFPDAGTGGAAGYQNPAPSSGTITPGGVGTAPSTNVAWSQQATEALAALGYDVGTLSAVIGKYLTRQPLTAQEQQWIQTAWAYVGKPPDGAYPIVTAPGTTPTPTPTPVPKPTAWKGPLVRKASGGPVRSINTARGSGSGRWTWAQVVTQMYNNVPPDPARLSAAGHELYLANAWRLGKGKNGPTASTVAVNSTVSVPSTIYV